MKITQCPYCGYQKDIIKTWTGDIDYYYTDGKLTGSNWMVLAIEYECMKCNRLWDIKKKKKNNHALS